MTSHLPHDQLTEVVRDIERRLAALERTAPLESTSVGAGGIRVLDGGALSFLDAAGTVVAVFDADGYVRTGANVDDTTQTLTGSYQQVAAVTFTPPAGWGSYRIVGQGGMWVKNGSADSQKRTVLTIGGNDGPSLTDTQGGTLSYFHTVAHDRVTSGTVSVAVRSRQLDVWASPTKHWASVSFIAVRES